MRRWVVVGGMLVLGVAYVVHGMLFRAELEEPTLRVVRTWGQLRDGDGFELSPFDRVWVGIETHEVSEDEGALVYVFFRQQQGPQGDVEALAAGAGVGLRVNGEILTTLMGPWGNRNAITSYWRAIYPSLSGVLDVAFVAEGTTVAEANLRVTEGTPGFWRVLHQDQSYELSDDGIVNVALTNTGGPAALPSVRSWTLREAPHEDDEAPPRLIPEAADLSLLATTRGFVLRLPQRVAPAQPHDILLARFEVVADPDTTATTQNNSTLPFIVNANLDWGFETLGAEPGDRVSLELLWCPLGWTLDGSLRSEGRLDSRASPRRSNRITVTVP